MALKRWAVRQISSLLSDYLEGITEKNLQASLSLEVGEIEIRHVRVHSGLLAEQHLDLLSSDVSVSARIPWRNLGSEPTLITVRDVWAEVHAMPPDRERSPEESEEVLRRWRKRRALQVQARVEAAREAAAAMCREDDQGKRRSIGARLGHAALRQLQIRFEGLHVRVHQDCVAAPTMDLRCSRIALDEGSTAVGDYRNAEVPQEIRRHPANLDKILEFVDLSLHLFANSPTSLSWNDPGLYLLRERLASRQRSLVDVRANSEETAARDRELTQTKSQLQRGDSFVVPVFGPVSLDVRLWHSLADGLLWSCVNLRVDRSASVMNLTPCVVQHLSSSMEWYSLTIGRQPDFSKQQARRGQCQDAKSDERDVPSFSTADPHAGHKYMELCCKRLQHDISSDDEASLEEIEDIAPVEWLARWQMRVHEQLHSVHPAISQQATNSNWSRGPGVLRWLTRGWSTRDEAMEEMYQTTSTDEDGEADCEQEEIDIQDHDLEEPKRVELRCCIPLCTIVSCSLDSCGASVRTLHFEGGAECRAAIMIAPTGTMASLGQAAFDADLHANLSSTAIRLDDESLMLLQREPREEQRGTNDFKRDSSNEEEFFDVQSDEDSCEPVSNDTSAPVRLMLKCVCRGGAKTPTGSMDSDGAVPTWSVGMRLKQEPFRFTLAPHSMHSALDIVVDMMTSILAAGHRGIANESTCTGSGQDLTEPENDDVQASSLRKSPEADVCGWQVTVNSDSVRWMLTPAVLEAAGQLTWSLEFVIGPPRNPAEKPKVGSPLWAAGVAPGGLIHASFERTVLVYGMGSLGGPCVCAAFEGAAVEYSACLGKNDCNTQVAHCELSYENQPLITCTKGGSLNIQNADRHLSVTGGSALIAVEWRELCVRGAAALLVETYDGLYVGEHSFGGALRRMQKLLPMSEDAGAFARDWGQKVIKDLQARVQEQVSSRIAELLPGDGKSEGGSGMQTGKNDDPINTKDQTAFPTPRGDCSVKVHLAYEGLTSIFIGAEGASTSKQCPGTKVVELSITGAECGFSGFLSGDVAGSISLGAVDLLFSGRRLLTPRRTDKILKVNLVRLADAQQSLFWNASWAQVCVLFWQRDFDHLQTFFRLSVLEVLAEFQSINVDGPSAQVVDSIAKFQSINVDGPSAQVVDSTLSRGCSGEIGEHFADVSDGPCSDLEADREIDQVAVGNQPTLQHRPVQISACFRLDIGAPLVFVPTSGCDFEKQNRGFDQLEVVDERTGEPGFKPRNGEGFLVFDFGHVAASGGGDASREGQIELQLRGAHVLGSLPENQNIRELLQPLTWDVVLKTGEGPIEFHAVSTTTKRQQKQSHLGKVVHKLSLTRAQLTLILDVLAENICYTGRSTWALPGDDCDARGRMGSETSLASLPASCSSKGSSKGRGFKFSWKWPGELVFDISFTETAPIARWCFLQGGFSIDMSKASSIYDVYCSGLSVTDLRSSSKNAVKTLLEIESVPRDSRGFGVNVYIPSDSDMTTLIHISHPVMYVLPQLVLDLVTVGVSSWQHCTFRNDKQDSPLQVIGENSFATDTQSMSVGRSLSAKSSDNQGTRVQVYLSDGVFRIAEQWDEPSDNFEFAGSLVICLLVHSSGTRIERFDLEGGALRLHSKRHPTTTLCPCLEWIVRGEQRRVDDGLRMKRNTNYDMRSIVLPPYSIRVSMRHHRALVRAVMELISLDAETAEPAEEINSRDPFALDLKENRVMLTCELALQGAEVQIMGEEQGHEWPAFKALTRCPLVEVAVETRQGVSPTINVFCKELELEIWTHNHRIGAWEPVLAPCYWKLSYHMQRKPDGGPREVFIRGDVEAIKPVGLVISAPFLQLATTIFNESDKDVKYGHLLAGVNIAGVPCQVTVEGGESCLLNVESGIESLDWILKGSGRPGQQTHPHLKIAVAGHPGARTCHVPLGRESAIQWDTEAVGFLFCRMIMLRPPRLMLLVSSTVCVWNRTSTDLEIRFLTPSTSSSPGGSQSYALMPLFACDACRCVDARVVTGVDKKGNADPDRQALDNVCVWPCGPDGALKLPSGCLLSAPPEAQLRMGQVVLQIRPTNSANSGDVPYDWSDSFFSVSSTEGDGGARTLVSAPRKGEEISHSLPHLWFHLHSDCSSNDGWCTVEVQAPLTLLNACPCDIYCRLNPPVHRKHLGQEATRFSIQPGLAIDLVVEDGRGGEVRVPQGGQAEILPLQLDDEGFFQWSCGGNRYRQRAKRDANGIVARLDVRRGEIVWHFFYATMQLYDAAKSNAHWRVLSQSSHPMYDSISEGVSVSFALRDTEGFLTAWSFPIQAISSMHSVEEVVELEHRGMTVRLMVSRRRRELVVHSKLWFANSTGLPVKLVQPVAEGSMRVVRTFGEHVAFLPQVRNESGEHVVLLELAGEEPVEVRVPDEGGTQTVCLTSLRACCLCSERLALSESMRGIQCSLVSLVPAMLMFNRVQTMELGFRQFGCPADTAVWLQPGSSSPLFWTSNSNQLLQLSAKRISAGNPASRQTAWSTPFEVKESRIGSYPLALPAGPSSCCLMCVSIDQDSLVLALTVDGKDLCHSLINKHPSISLDLSVGNAAEDHASIFRVPPGGRTAFASKSPQDIGASRLQLTLKRTNASEERATVVVDLCRAGVFRVPMRSNCDSPQIPCATRSPGKKIPRSTLRQPIIVTTQIQNRVAVITVTPGEQATVVDDNFGESESLQTIQGELKVELLTVALVADRISNSLAIPDYSLFAGGTSSPSPAEAARQKKHEVFTITIAGVGTHVRQTARQRDLNFTIRSLQIDLQGATQDCVFRNTTSPFLRAMCQRDDVGSLDVRLKDLQLNFGEVEVSVTNALFEKARELRKNFVLGNRGIALDEALQRAEVAYHFLRRGPPAKSSKLVVSNLVIGDARVIVWCRLNLVDAQAIPLSIREALKVVTFSNCLDIKGAQVKFPRQVLFCNPAPVEGTLGTVIGIISNHYLPHVKASWRSLLQHSNIFLGGLFARHTWRPRQRKHHRLSKPLCLIGSGGEIQINILPAAESQGSELAR